MTWRDLILKLMAAMFLGLPDARPLPPVRSGVTRREFLKLAGVAAATVAILPSSLALDEALPALDASCGLNAADLDAIFKELYEPVIREMLSRESVLMHFIDAAEGRSRGVVVPVKVGKNYYTGYRR